MPNSNDDTMDPKISSEHWNNLRGQLSQKVMVSRCFATLRDMTDERCIAPDQLKFVKAMGTGAFATVSKAIFTAIDRRKTLVAVKRLKDHLLDDETEMHQLVGEISLLRKLRNGSVVEYLGIGQEDGPTGRLFLVEELMEGGSLKHMVTRQMLLNGHILYTYGDALRWALQVAKGLKYLHSASPMVIHRDLKLDNVLLTGGEVHRMNAKICDFGLSVLVDPARGPLKQHLQDVSAGLSPTLSRELEQEWNNRTLKHSLSRSFKRSLTSSRKGASKSYHMSGQTGSLMYMAPEVFKFEPYNEKADVFSFGVMQYEVFYRYMMLSAVSVQGTVEELERYAARVSAGYRPPLDDKLLTPELNHVIARCWAQDPRDRPDMAWVVERLREIEQKEVLVGLDLREEQKTKGSCSCFG